MKRNLLRHLSLSSLFLVAVAGSAAVQAQDFVVWQAYNVKFEGSRTVLLASTYVLNPSAKDYRNLVFSARAPEGFALKLPPEEIQRASRRPEGFSEKVEDGAYHMTQPFLGANQATTIFYELDFGTPALDVTFPGLSIAYEHRDEKRAFQAQDEVNSLARIRRFSGDIGDYIKRNAQFSLDLGQADWTFTALDYRAFAQNPIGIVDISGSPEGSGNLRVQKGYPGSFLEILVRWEPKARGKKEPIDHGFARAALDTMIRWVGDFGVDADSVKASDTKVARYPAVLIEGRWVDNKPMRLGSGPFRLYVVNDPRTDRDFYLYLGAQGRGIGPGNADTAAPEVEERLMTELVGYLENFKP